MKINKKNLFRVIMYHDINPRDFPKLEHQLSLFKSDGWQFIKPSQLYNINKAKGKKILLTFDDGFYSHKLIAEKILKKLSINAIFFIPSDFINLDKKDDKLIFIKNNLELKKFNFSNKEISLSINDLISLYKKKHSIGFHTKKHVHLSKISSTFKLKDQIISFQDYGFKKIVNKKFFSFPFGTMEDLSFESLKISRNYYDFSFLGIRGNNSEKNLKLKIIFRDNMLVTYSKFISIAIINGYFDIKYLLIKWNILKKL